LNVNIKVKRLPGGKLPVKANPDDACFDLFARIDQDIILKPGCRVCIPAGVILEIPKGYKANVCPKSGLAKNNGIDTLAGKIDAGYRDEIGIIVYNTNQPLKANPFANLGGVYKSSPVVENTLPSDTLTIKPGMKIAQIEIVENLDVTIEEVAEIDMNTDRGLGGFGSSGDGLNG
jgi:dUTP pyrophosphatase